MLRRTGPAPLLLAFALISFGPTGCGPSALVEDYCDAKCECEGCTDEEREICGIRGQAREDVADAYGCGDDYEAYRTCVVDKSECDEIDGQDFYGPTCEDIECDCDDELDDYSECRDDASKEGLLDFD